MEPGLFVTPKLEVAKRFGRAVVAIEIDSFDLQVPPNLKAYGATLETAWANPHEEQGFLAKRIEPGQVALANHEEPRNARPGLPLTHG
jgi:hypothetical protein